jgi:geranylgeranyl pyrophosphate synthase
LASDPFSDQRAHLLAALNDAIAGLEFSHSQLLGQRMSSLSGADADDAFLPALLCSLTAEALGAPSDVALTAATALALVEATAYVVDDLVVAGSSSQSPGLIDHWGVPRTLNAADAFFALGHDVLIRVEHERFDAARVLELTDAFNDACRDWSEETNSRLGTAAGVSKHPSPALLSAAVRIGATIAGADRHTAAVSTAVFRNDASTLKTILSPHAAARLGEAASYLAGVSR